VRTLESRADEKGRVSPGAGETDLFIYPGYKFRAVDALVTNFHLPLHTPLLLASAFAGEDFLKKSYKEAVDEQYRFFSYGDAMVIL
jgi:S-adenosylmethionine:tRNA ribosyltransferase-isomerase